MTFNDSNTMSTPPQKKTTTNATHVNEIAWLIEFQFCIDFASSDLQLDNTISPVN